MFGAVEVHQMVEGRPSQPCSSAAFASAMIESMPRRGE
jgi:hypothetical protein